MFNLRIAAGAPRRLGFLLAISAGVAGPVSYSNADTRSAVQAAAPARTAYQRTVYSFCTGSDALCDMSVLKAGAQRRLEIDHVSCLATSRGYPRQLKLATTGDTAFLVPEQTTGGVAIYTNAIAFVVEPGGEMIATYVSSNDVTGLTCTVTGTRAVVK